MTVVKVHMFDVKTNKRRVIERDIKLPQIVSEIEGVDLTEVRNLVTHAKEQGWI